MALPDLIPVETFFADPEFAGASISPDGTRIAYLAPVAGPNGVERLQVWMRGRDETHEQAVAITHDFNRGVKSYQWSDNPRWMLFTQDYEGNEDHHLYRVDLDDPAFAAVDLTPMDPGSRVMGYAPFKAKPGSYVVSMNKRPAFVESFEVVIETGETTCLRENESLMGGYSVGPTGELFWAGIAEDDSNDWIFEAVDPETDARRTVFRLSGKEMPMGAVPQEITPDGKGVIVAAYPEGSDDLSLVRYDVATGEQTIIAALAGHDVCTAHYVAEWFPPMIYKSRATGEIIAVRFFGPRPTIHVIDPDFQPILDKIAAIAPDSVVSSMSSDKSLRHWVVSFTNDREPDVTYLYDHETGESTVLFKPYPSIDPADMAPMEYVEIEARDGLPIPCFLTLPVGIEAKNLPLVLHIHGGPWFHDIWCYDRETQFFANRGYAVLQVNFRGSSGQGKRHINAAKHELSRKMHDDLIDVADHLVKEGIVDPDRIAHFGGSYGGYSGNVAATVTPDYFAVICSYMGIGSLKNFITSLPLFLRKQISNNWIEYVGDPDDPAQLADMEACSPINFVDRVKTPMLIVQGAHDARVKQSEADEFVAGARAAGADVDYLLFPDEGHAFRKVENIVEMCKRVDVLFAKHLGGRTA